MTAAPPEAFTSSPNSRSTSMLTAAKISAGAPSCATRVATRRSAACSSASPLRSSCAWAFEIAVATSSVKAPRRAWVSRGDAVESTIRPL